MFGIGAVQQAVDKLKTTVEGLQDTLTNVIKQGLADIKTSIDQIGGAAQRTSESAGAISRKVDNLHTEIQTLRTDIERLRDTARTAAESRSDDRILLEIADLRATVEGWRADTAQTRLAATEATQTGQQAPTTPDEADTNDFDELLDLAAGIAYAEISCHRDTWDFLVAQSSRGEHFRLPGAVTEKDCLIDADLSGRALIAALDALWHAQRNQEVEPGTRRLAAKVYGRIGDALRKVEANGSPEQEGDGEQSQPDVTRIVIDDRPPA